MAAAQALALESVRLLLAAGASVHRTNEHGDTALMSALLSEATDATAVPRVVEELLDAGASVAARDCDGLTPLHQLAMTHATKPWAAAVARLLLANGASGRLTNEEGETPAECLPAGAARDGELYELLLEAEADSSEEQA
jgi:ankyrin repeat protein